MDATSPANLLENADQTRCNSPAGESSYSLTMLQNMFASTSGNLLDRITQRWVQLTGRVVDFTAEHRWLDGPTGEPCGIGVEYFQEFARKHQLRIGPGIGLLERFSFLRSSTFDPRQVSQHVLDFYERTSDYSLDAWSEWSGLFRPFGRMLALIFSRRLQQLNVPLSPLDTSRGVSSEILRVSDPRSGRAMFTAWLRRLLGSGDVLYAGAYSTCQLPSHEGAHVKVVFPLPNGSAIVIMRPMVHEDGSFSVASHGKGFGDPGFYFTVHSRRGTHARYVRALRESIRVYATEDGVVRADHVLSLFRLTFLRLHYRMVRKQGAEARSGRS